MPLTSSVNDTYLLMIDLDSEQMQAAQDFDEFLWDGYLHNGGGVYTDISLKLQ